MPHWWDRYNLAILLQDADTSITNDTLVAAFLDSFAGSVTGKLLQIRSEMDTLDLQDSLNYATLNSDISSVSPDNDMDHNLQHYASLYLYGVKHGVDGEIENAVSNIAVQCVYEGGPSVLEARAFMLAQDLSLMGHDWDTLCGTGSYKKGVDAVLEKPLADYRLVPNLYRDNFSAHISLGEGEAGEVIIFAMDGRVMGRHSVRAGSNQLDLSNDGLTAGVFLYKVIVNGETKNNGKLVVVH